MIDLKVVGARLTHTIIECKPIDDTPRNMIN